MPPPFNDGGGYFRRLVSYCFNYGGWNLVMSIVPGSCEKSTSMPLVEVLCCGPALIPDSYPLLLTITSDFIWNRDGERRIVPANILIQARETKAAYRTLEKYKRVPCIPKDIGVILWEQARPYMQLGNAEVIFQPGPTV